MGETFPGILVYVPPDRTVTSTGVTPQWRDQIWEGCIWVARYGICRSLLSAWLGSNQIIELFLPKGLIDVPDAAGEVDGAIA
jgi:hypothetical protein